MWLFIFFVYSSDWYIDKYGVEYEDRECKVLVKATKTDLIEYEVPFSVERIVDSTSITEGPFYGTRESLKSIKFCEGSNLEILGIYCFSRLLIQSIDFSACTKLKALSYGCLKECSKIELIKFPPNLEHIKTGSLMSLDIITRMDFPSSLTTIDGYQEPYVYSLANCPKLASISFGIDSNLTKLGSVSFSNCGLTSIFLPKKLKTIGMNSFVGCPITSISVDEDNKDFSTDGTALYNIDKTTLILVPYVVSGEVYKVREGVNAIKGGCLSKIKAKTVSLPSSLASIGEESFLEAEIEWIYIPSAVTSISMNTFWKCKKLKNVTMEAKITTLPEYIFRECSSLQSFRIPNGVTKIKERAFVYCSSLSYVFVPKTVTVIESAVFFGTKDGINVEFETGSPIKVKDDTIITPNGLKIIAYIGTTSPLKLKISSIVQIIGSNAYTNKNVSVLEFEEGSALTTIESGAFSNCTILSISFPPLLTTIGSSAFSGCSTLNKVVFQESLEEIGSSAFLNCAKLTSLSFPKKLKRIGNSAFSNCSELNRITFHTESMLESIGSTAFSNTAITELSVPNSVRTIGSRSFAGSKLYSVVFNVAAEADWKITKGAFMECEELKQVFFGDVAGIGESSFEGCIALESLNIGWNVKEIGPYALKGCESLETIVLSESRSLESIEKFAFSGCVRLSRFDIGSENSHIGTMYDDSVLFAEFGGDRFGKLLTFLPNSGAKAIKLMTSTKRIAAYAFEGALRLESVIIPDGSVTEIGFNAFLNCVSLSYVSFGDSVTDFGNLLFEGCTALSCGSVKYLDWQRELLVNTGVDEKVLVPCPTGAFSAGAAEGVNLILVGALSALTGDDLPLE